MINRSLPGPDDLTRLRRRLLCDWLQVHTGSLESYGQYSYINCERCNELRQPMPRWYAERRYG